SHYAVVTKIVVEEEVILVMGHTVVEKKFIHSGFYSAAVIKIEREESFGIHYFGGLDGLGIFSVIVLRGFALDEDGVRPDLENAFHRQDVGLHDVFQGRNECRIIPELFVPPPVTRRKNRADIHFVYRRKKL